MDVAQGILTARGGMTSHAAVVARGMGTPCVAGAGDLRIDYAAKTLTAGNTVLNEGDIITLDGSTGQVLQGEVPKIQPEQTGDFGTLMAWVDEIRKLRVRANADTPLDASSARKFGGEGIGLCRTEHMFFDPQRIIDVREMIVADTEAERRTALDKLLPYQRDDFVQLFTIMDGLPVTIRLLDPPLHEFLPHSDADMAEVAKAAGKTVAEVKAKASQLHEANPMLGHRGCRLGITYPEIYEMQCRAIIEAVADVKMKGETVLPEIMIPLVAVKSEFDRLKADGRSRRQGDDGEDRRQVRVPGRHDDRAAARRPDRRRDRRGRGVLQLRHQRPDADDLRPLARRRRPVPGAVPGAGGDRERSVPDARPGGRRRADQDRGRARPQDPARHQARHLRRARRRPGLACTSATRSA